MPKAGPSVTWVPAMATTHPITTDVAPWARRANPDAAMLLACRASEATMQEPSRGPRKIPSCQRPPRDAHQGPCRLSGGATRSRHEASRRRPRPRLRGQPLQFADCWGSNQRSSPSRHPPSWRSPSTRETIDRSLEKVNHNLSSPVFFSTGLRYTSKSGN